MSDRDDRIVVFETGNSGGIINGVIITCLILLGVFFLIAGQLPGGPQNNNVDVNPPKLATPAE
jgi:hypothetical protein